MAQKRNAPGQMLFDFDATPDETSEDPLPPASEQPVSQQTLPFGPQDVLAEPEDPPATSPEAEDPPSAEILNYPEQPAATATGEKAKARDVLAAIRTLKLVEQEQRSPTAQERQALARFCGFGPLALTIFPDPITGRYKDASWQAMGEELRELLTPEEYESAKRTTFNAFYTSSTVIKAMYEALNRLGVPPDAQVLEPGCGSGRFPMFAPEGYRFIGVELDSISARIARALHPQADIRIENFRDSKLPEIDAVIGNVPFADIKLEHCGQRFSLHDYFFAKSVDSLRPGGVLALVTSHFTLDKQNAAIREYLGERADFLGAIRLPADAFKREGTSVVTDIVFLRKRAPGEPANHVNPAWLEVEPLEIEGASVPINRYFLNYPLCGGPHKGCYVVEFIMWRRASPRAFTRAISSRNAT